MAEELFKVRELVHVAAGKSYPTGEEVTKALCSLCFRLYHENGFPIESAGNITPEWVHAKGPSAISTMLTVRLHRTHGCTSKGDQPCTACPERIRVPCELCGRDASDQGEYSGGAKVADYQATGLKA